MVEIAVLHSVFGVLSEVEQLERLDCNAASFDFGNGDEAVSSVSVVIIKSIRLSPDGVDLLLCFGSLD